MFLKLWRRGLGWSMTSSPKPKKSPSRRNARKITDKLMSLFAILRDGRCVTCGSTDNLQGGHYFGRVMFSVRYDPRNVYCQCAGCNILHESNSEPLRKVVIDTIGIDGFDSLALKANSPVPGGKIDYVSEQDRVRGAIERLSRFKRLHVRLQWDILLAKSANYVLIHAIKDEDLA